MKALLSTLQFQNSPIAPPNLYGKWPYRTFPFSLMKAPLPAQGIHSPCGSNKLLNNVPVGQGIHSPSNKIKFVGQEHSPFSGIHGLFSLVLYGRTIDESGSGILAFFCYHSTNTFNAFINWCGTVFVVSVFGKYLNSSFVFRTRNTFVPFQNCICSLRITGTNLTYCIF